MHPNEKRATENRRSHAALVRYVVTAANRWAVSGYQWMHEKDQQQEQQPLKPRRSMFCVTNSAALAISLCQGWYVWNFILII